MLNQTKLAALVGSSKRTVQRWDDHSHPSYDVLRQLADMVRSEDPALAAEIDRHAPPPPAPPVAAPPAPVAAPAVLSPAPSAAPVPDVVLVDSVVCAAAEAMGVVPHAVRPALLAAFSRARDARLSVDVVVASLAPPAGVKLV
jgi:hypothetical protein